ncbi:VanZ family protein [Cellulomonas humilata]|uniref:VanZ family protein n=1 Tax=Cellulomonas humilata TaxID=144055 RepID=A0A7Y6A1T6_9CELL|nr:VanZ family protein [Cellulomonas humilata]
MTDQRTPALRRAATVAFVAYLVVLAGAAFLPLPSMQLERGTGPSYDLALRRPDLLGGWEVQRNVLMTIPFGILLPLVVRWRYEVLVLACVGVTLVIETVQLLVSASVGWAWRAFDVNDLLLNTVGGLLGLAFTAAVLAAVRRPPLPPVRRLVPGAMAAALVVWAVVATLTPPPTRPVVYACDEPPAGTITELPGGASAYAGRDGSVCLRADDGTASLPYDAGPGPAFTFERSDGTWEVGTAQAGDVLTAGVGGPVVELHAVDGSDVLVWAARR